MGEAPPADRQAQLLQVALSLPGVESAHELLARYDGAQLQVTLHVVVDDSLSLRAAHDIGRRGRGEPAARADVLSAMVHVDADADRGSREQRHVNKDT